MSSPASSIAISLASIHSCLVCPVQLRAKHLSISSCPPQYHQSTAEHVCCFFPISAQFRYSPASVHSRHLTHSPTRVGRIAASSSRIRRSSSPSRTSGLRGWRRRTPRHLKSAAHSWGRWSRSRHLEGLRLGALRWSRWLRWLMMRWGCRVRVAMERLAGLGWLRRWTL